MALFSKGIILTQNKEPAISQPIVAFTDSKTKYFKPAEESFSDIDYIQSEDIITLARQANIYDDIDNQPLADKLMLNRYVVKKLYINAIDDEPYVSSRIALCIHMQNELKMGIDLCAKALGINFDAKANNIVIEVYKNTGDIKASVPSKIGDIPIKKISGGYPALLSHKKSDDSGNKNDLLIGVSTLIHLYRAVVYKMVHNTTFVTVAGNSISKPMNLEVSFGMNFADLLNRCGISHFPDKVINGGSMRGISLIDPSNTLVTPNTRSVLAFHGQTHEKAYSCIGCGRCETGCPVGLNPMYIYNIMEKRAYAELHRFDPKYCIQCGLCSYVCPSRLAISSSVIKAKAILNSVQQEEALIGSFKSKRRQKELDRIEVDRLVRAEKAKFRNEKIKENLINIKTMLAEKATEINKKATELKQKVAENSKAKELASKDLDTIKKVEISKVEVIASEHIETPEIVNDDKTTTEKPLTPSFKNDSDNIEEKAEKSEPNAAQEMEADFPPSAQLNVEDKNKEDSNAT